MAGKRRKREYTWLLHPIGSHTNEAFASRLPTENFIEEALCSDGVRRPFWASPSYALIRQFQASAVDLDLRFLVFVQVGKGQIRRAFNFQGNRRRRRRAA